MTKENKLSAAYYSELVSELIILSTLLFQILHKMINTWVFEINLSENMSLEIIH